MDLASFIPVYFASKNVYLVTAFLCWQTDEVLKLWRESQSLGVRLRVVSDWQQIPELPAYDTHREGIVFGVGCPESELVLEKASVNRAFNLRYSWLFIEHSLFNTSTIKAVLGDYDILPDADTVWTSSDLSVDVYRVKQGQPLLVSELAIYRKMTRVELDATWRRMPTAVARRKDLHNVYLKAATIISQPQHFKGWSDLNNRAIDTFPKLTYPLLMLAAEDLHFRYNLKQVDLYGEEHNGSFDGLAGLLQRGQLEVGVTSMFMRSDRWRVLHFCSETVELRLPTMFRENQHIEKGAFLFRQPAQSAVANVFVLPFSRGVWAAAAAVFAGAGALLALLAAAARAARLPDPAASHLATLDCLTFVIGSMCQQGSDLSPRLWSLRLVMFFTLLASLFAFTSYSAKVVAILQSPSNALQTIDDLTNSPMTLGVQETTYKKVYFAESRSAATRRLYRRKLRPLGERAYLSAAAGVERLRTGLFAFQVEQGSGYDIISKTFTEHEKCGLKEIQAFKLPMVAVPIRRHSGYRDLLASRLRWQRETGMTARARCTWLAAAPRCAGGGAGFASVGLHDVLPALQALLIGFTLAALLLPFEALLHAMRRH
ncbi:unnamed protein product [Parnassius apollo]|uniref:(apollo) hypothetical protein n=1 Tax=Parnassius apollo TaxID=110799 RepID=A0A8S3WJN0_PARAO|nr:unnamed protein product [Parnassius apollo]